MEDGRKCAKLVNICVDISISKMEENVKMEENISGILCFIISRKVKNAMGAQEKICAVYGEDAMTDQTCQKWFVKFHAGGFLLDSVPWLGRQLKLIAIK